MQPDADDLTTPDWASRWLSPREVATIQGEDRSTVYRKAKAGIYPPFVQFGSSSRMAGWQLWACGQRRLAARESQAA